MGPASSLLSSASVRRPSSRAVMLCLVVAVAYVGAAQAGFAFAFATKQVTAIWPPTGLALAALVLGGPRLWPGVLLGAFVANITSDEAVVTAALVAVGNTAEAVVGAWFVRRTPGFRPTLERTRDILTLVCFAAFVSTMISATIGVLALWGGGIVNGGSAIAVWRVWWLGDAGGDLLVAPVLLVFGSLILERGRAAWPVIVQCAAAAGGLALLGVVVFRTDEPMAYVLFPVVFAIALQLRQPGTTLGTLALASIAVWATSHGHGQFAGADPDVAMVRAQTYVGVLAFASLLLTAARAEGQRAESDVQEQRAVNRDLAAASEAKSRFLANVSHELRTPIHVICGFAATLLTERPGPLSPSQKEQLQAIGRSGDHLNGLITELIELARNEVGKTTLVMAPVECTGLLRDVADEMRQLASDKGLELAIDDAAAVVVRTDRRALRQILINLTGNAIKFTELGQVRLSIADGVDGSVRLTVSDTGPGITDDEVDRIFEAFEQGVPAYEGLGLGLHISRSLADRLDAKLTVYSVPGDGSEFTIELPPKPRETSHSEHVVRAG
ncbi:MAG: MASE1 domain-containing protein [Aeromicrobium sp.]